MRWLEVFLDRPRAAADSAGEFWTRATATRLSPWRDGHTFATLLPDVGTPYLRLQAVDELAPRGGVHVDLRVHDLAAETRRLMALGAEVRRRAADLVVLRSPSGLPLCLTPYDDPGCREHQEHLRRPPPVGEPAVRLDQVTVDVPGLRYEQEAAFWRGASGWERLAGSTSEFEVLRPPGWGVGDPEGQAGPPVRFLFQRLGEQDGPTGMHVDLACADRRATISAHLADGARVVGEGRRWTVLTDPFGVVYCLTDRDPVTGVLPPLGTP